MWSVDVVLSAEALTCDIGENVELSLGLGGMNVMLLFLMRDVDLIVLNHF